MDGSSETPEHVWAEPFRLTSEKTGLRPSRLSDAARLFPHVHGQPRVTDWLCWDGPETEMDLADRYMVWRLGKVHAPVYVFILERLPGGEVIGEGTLRFDGDPGTGDLGYWLGAPFHGQGHGSEAVALLVEAGFGHCGARSLSAKVKAGNEASLCALRRSGFAIERAEGVSDEDFARDWEGMPAKDRPILWNAALGRGEWHGA